MKFKPGVKYGSELRDLLAYAKENEFALPAVNVIGTNSVNAVLETAKKIKLTCNHSIFEWGSPVFCR